MTDLPPIVCANCNKRLSANQITDTEYDTLLNEHSYHALEAELRMLLKVKEYFRRYPKAQNESRARFKDLGRSLKQQTAADRTNKPRPESGRQLRIEDEHTLEQEVEAYLRNHYFRLDQRLEFVSEAVLRLRRFVNAVPCPNCAYGHLTVLPDDWDNFVSFRSVTWIWPDWYSLDDDGTLHVKCSGWLADRHWTGMQSLAPDDSDYALVSWLVSQPKYHRLIDTDELPAIKEEWMKCSNKNPLERDT